MFLRAHRSSRGAAIGGLVLAIVLLTSGIAVADDSAPPPDPTTTVPAASTSSADPGVTDPGTTDPSTTDSTSDAAPDPTSDASAAPADPSLPSTSIGQDATVDNSQTGVANTGVNTVVGDDSPSVPSNDGSGSPSAAASVNTGNSTAVGGDTQDAISQQATAIVTQAAHIVITQLALIVNIGLAVANSGANDADAGSSAAGGISLISTGDATVTGLGGSTAVTQVVNLLDAPEQTTQTAAVTNVGVGVGNTGANLAVGQMSGLEPDGTAVAVSWGPSDSSTIGTGAATAVGAQTHTTIVQVAMGTAADDGTINITQRAVVVNFGAAFANTGFDSAGGPSADATSLLVRGIVLALLAMLQPSAPTTTLSASSAAALAGDSSATVSTGSAVAVGNSSTTTIRQTASGSVTGDNQVSADQTATVGNFGFAFANTGVNAAGSALPLEVQAQLASIPAAFAGFLNLLAAPGDQAIWSTDLQIGAELLAASASVSAVESLFNLPGMAESSSAQVVVRQITGILNLMLSVAVSGLNHVTTSSDSTSEHAATASAQSSTGGTASASLHTGDAHVANLQTTTICQVINVSTSVCDPPAQGEPTTHSNPVAANTSDESAPTAVASASAAPTASQLAFTGSGSSFGPSAIAGLVAFLAGCLLVVSTRRRRVARR
jgi:hypothetical protein